MQLQNPTGKNTLQQDKIINKHFIVYIYDIYLK